MLLLSVAPLVLFVVLIFWKKTDLLLASILSLFCTLFLVVYVWQIFPELIFASITKGVSVAADILLIIFGALFFLSILERSKIIKNLCLSLEKISPDYRIQIILLAWFLENFLEGTAGFGTPSTIVAPLLIGIGLPPLTAVSVALLGNSASVVFGAAGTPIRVGFAGLNILGVPLYSALINLVGFIVPVFMLWLITSKQKNHRLHFREALPFAIFSGFSFVVPSVFLVFLGQEFPSIIGSIVGFFIVLLSIKLKIFVPKNIRILRQENLAVQRMSPFKIYFPYTLLIIFLIIGKFVLKTFNPGVAFILAAIPTIILFEKNKQFTFTLLKTSFLKAIEPFIVIALISIMVQLMINSGQNPTHHPSFLQIIASNLETPLLPFLAPFFGAFGSFLTGSATVSNIMFGGILQSTSLIIGLNSTIILSLQLVGAAAGNMIALADILPALAVVGLKGQATSVIKTVIIPCTIYLLLIGMVGIILTK